MSLVIADAGMIGYAALAARDRKMEKTIIDQMVDRFLCWQLPEDFAPDGGIKFTPPHLNDDKALHWPTGMCLLTAPQAKAMFEHCADGTAITDADEDAYVIDKLGRLLAEIAVIVNGPEPPLTRWSYHDLPEKVRALTAAAMAERERCAHIVDVSPDTDPMDVIGGEDGVTMLRELAAKIRNAQHRR